METGALLGTLPATLGLHRPVNQHHRPIGGVGTQHRTEGGRQRGEAGRPPRTAGDGLAHRGGVDRPRGALLGGLVARSACLAGAAAGQSWVGLVSDLVTLGTPHRGAPLEKLAHVAAWGLGLASETQPLAEWLDARSVGIKDLRIGAITQQDWEGIDPESLLWEAADPHPPGRDRTPLCGRRHHRQPPASPRGAARGPGGQGPERHRGAGMVATNVAVHAPVGHARLLDAPPGGRPVMDRLRPV
jgi:hypothetical protein